VERDAPGTCSQCFAEKDWTGQKSLFSFKSSPQVASGKQFTAAGFQICLLLLNLLCSEFAA